MNIITISREFGSGGRELGKRMADQMGYAYYDKEIISAIAKNCHMDGNYIEHLLSSSSFAYPITIGRTFYLPTYANEQEIQILVACQRILNYLATQGNCIVMGQAADAILHDLQPLNLFVYADEHAKIERCKKRAAQDENFTDKELKRKIKQVDEGRARQYELIAAETWGRKENYHLCINTTGINIKTLASVMVEYATVWLKEKNHENTTI